MPDAIAAAVPAPRRARSWLTRQRVPTASLRFRDLAAETRWLLGFAVLYVVAAIATGLVIRSAPLPIAGATDFLQDFWYAGVFKIGLLLVLPWLVARRWGVRWADLLYGWRLGGRSALGLLVAYAIGVGINLGRVDSIRVAYAAHAPVEGVLRVAAGMLLAFLQAGVPEEVVYRGLLQTRLEARWGRIVAILVTVVLFVAWHLPTRFFLARGVEGQAGDLGSVLVGTGIPVGIVGLLLGLAWDRWRNLPVLIALHAGIDTLPIVASMIQAQIVQTR